ncbi:MAG: hypothetical protein NTY64_00435 [Deltaproteobacteria bacterium]|nr:hypothetical protein [Deltaproteobacteria bacterium]
MMPLIAFIKNIVVSLKRGHGLTWASIIMFLLAAIFYLKIVNPPDEYLVYDRLPPQPVIYMPMLPPMNTGPGDAFREGLEVSIRGYTPERFKDKDPKQLVIKNPSQTIKIAE